MHCCMFRVGHIGFYSRLGGFLMVHVDRQRIWITMSIRNEIEIVNFLIKFVSYFITATARLY